ncbi:hypothetical protein AB6A40_009711 [Gnathostoma spinigerum]|uniref:Uncharacterized protein n=1 Tax=Gnathostoma spinigerum TaxID=75299 RepID=A0ABD6F1B8_9BILA
MIKLVLVGVLLHTILPNLYRFTVAYTSIPTIHFDNWKMSSASSSVFTKFDSYPGTGTSMGTISESEGVLQLKPTRHPKPTGTTSDTSDGQHQNPMRTVMFADPMKQRITSTLVGFIRPQFYDQCDILFNFEAETQQRS